LLPETCLANLDLSINPYCCIQLAFFFTIFAKGGRSNKY